LEYFIDKSPFTERLKWLALLEIWVRDSLSKTLSGNRNKWLSRQRKLEIDMFIAKMCLEDWNYFFKHSSFSSWVVEAMEWQIWIIYSDRKENIFEDDRLLNLSYEDFSDEDIKKVNEITEQQQIELLRKNPYIIQFIYNPSEALQIRAIEFDPYTYFWIREPSAMISNLFGEKMSWIKLDIVKIVEYRIADFKVKKQILSVFNDSEFNLWHFNYLNIISQYLDDISYNSQELWFCCNIDIADEYLKKYLEQIWHWRDRVIYALDDDKVIKWRWVKQNKWEYECYNDLNGSPIFPKIYWHWERFDWIVSERVMPISYWDFLKILHMPFDWGDKFDVKLEQRRPYQKLEQSKFDKFYHKYFIWDQRELEMKDRQNYSNATENNDRDDHWDYVEYSIKNPTIPEEIKECLKEWVIDNDTWELIEIADYESIYPEWVCLREFIYVMENYYIIKDIENKGIPTDHDNYMYKLYIQSKDRLDKVDKDRLVIYKKLARYDIRFSRLAEYIEYKPYTCDLSKKNFWFAMRDWKPFIVVLNSWFKWDN